MDILVLGLNYVPEPVGIGPYTAGMAESLVAAGHRVRVVCGHPYYPQWKVHPGFEGGARHSVENGVEVLRLPHYVPAEPNGRRRLLHHLSFAARALPAMLSAIRRRRPDVIIAIAPSLVSTIAAHVAARVSGAKLWLHIQDFEVEAAFATGLLNERGSVARVARWFEHSALSGDRVSTISPQMCAKLLEQGIPQERIVEFRNWADTDAIQPRQSASSYRAEWNIDRPHVALYSGNIANKQGIEIVVAAAQRLRDRRDLMFVVCGNGPNRENLVASAAGCDNIRFHDLQPVERLSDLLGLATVHLLPQIAGAADLVLPSKLTNMLSSGRPVVATALPGTGLAHEVEGCGLLTPPGDATAFADAIAALVDDPQERARMGVVARDRSVERWSKGATLGRFEQQVRALAAEAKRR
jgi:colanic acid biosynthesis glycosyl transferase WcaI